MELPESYGVRLPRHDQPVPRGWVHRASVHDVFVTDLVILGPARAACGVQWPRHHLLTGPGAASALDLILVLEAVRQIGVCLAHKLHAVPPGWTFVADSISVDLHHPTVRFGRHPMDGTAHATCTRARGGRARFDLDVRFEVSGQQIATGTGRLRCIAPAVYDRLRGHGRASSDDLAPPPSAHLAAATGPGEGNDVLLAAKNGNGHTLRVDPTDPFFFDHPLDHVPASLLVQAARHAVALQAPDMRVRYAALTCERYVELNQTCSISVRQLAVDEYEVGFDQNGRTAALVQARGRP